MTPLSIDSMNTDRSSLGQTPLKSFPDWLSISFPASVSPLIEVLDIFAQVESYETVPKAKDKTLYRFLSGTILVTHTDSFHNISISGGVLELIRNCTLNSDFIMLLSSVPHNITRLDVAVDIPTPGHLVLSSLRSNHSAGTCDIAGHRRNITYVTSQDLFNPERETGTAYFQSKSYRGYVKLRVYDKIHEIACSTDDKAVHTLLRSKSLTRYELTVSKGASLDDYARPDNIFWHYMPETVLKRPQNVSVAPWSPSERVPYDSVDKSSPTDYERLRAVLEQSQTLQQIVRNASSVNGGIGLLHRIIDSQRSDDDFA